MSKVMAYKILPKGSFSAESQDEITLDEEDRYRRRIALVTDTGFEFLLNLKKAERINHGDGLLLDNGHIVRVLAKPEALLKVTARDGHHLLQLAWHLGNRHQPSEIHPDHLRIRQDAVIADMLEGLGATIEPMEAPFSPMSGAYVAKKSGEDHTHGDGHHHDHAH